MKLTVVPFRPITSFPLTRCYVPSTDARAVANTRRGEGRHVPGALLPRPGPPPSPAAPVPLPCSGGPRRGAGHLPVPLSGLSCLLCSHFKNAVLRRKSTYVCSSLGAGRSAFHGTFNCMEVTSFHPHAWLTVGLADNVYAAPRSSRSPKGLPAVLPFPHLLGTTYCFFLSGSSRHTCVAQLG